MAGVARQTAADVKNSWIRTGVRKGLRRLNMENVPHAEDIIVGAIIGDLLDIMTIQVKNKKEDA